MMKNMLSTLFESLRYAAMMVLWCIAWMLWGPDGEFPRPSFRRSQRNRVESHK